MAVVSVAIILSFHLKRAPTPFERRIALPLGLIFWFLALACVGLGLVNYFLAVRGYAKRQALVQSGLSTQIVSTSSHTISLYRETTWLQSVYLWRAGLSFLLCGRANVGQ